MFHLVSTFEKFGRLLLLSLLLLVSGDPVEAQNTSNLHSAATSNHAVAGNNREQDGLAGPVRRVRTEIANLLQKDGKLVESARVLLETTTYDRLGNRVDNSFFAVASTSLVGKEVYKYDDKGNIVEMTVRDDNGSTVSQEVYAYEFDALGNWTKMTASVAVIENGNTIYEPTEVTYRTIAYYRTDDVAKVIQPATTPNNSPDRAVAALPDEGSESVKRAGEQKPDKAAGESLQIPSGQLATPRNTEETGTSPASTTVVSNTGEIGSSVATSTAKEGGNANLAQPSVTEQPAPKPPVKPISGGVLNGKAINIPLPIYPGFAKQAGYEGIVSVEVLIDVTGKVISAKAVSGPNMFRRAAEDAARKAQFSPTLLSGQPMRVTGIINYNFYIKQ